MREPWEERKTRERKRSGRRKSEWERGMGDGTTRNETRGVFIAVVVKAVRPASVHRRFDTYRVFGNWWYKREESRSFGGGNGTDVFLRADSVFRLRNLNAKAARISRLRAPNEYDYEYQKFRYFSGILSLITDHYTCKCIYTCTLSFDPWAKEAADQLLFSTISTS